MGTIAKKKVIFKKKAVKKKTPKASPSKKIKIPSRKIKKAIRRKKSIKKQVKRPLTKKEIQHLYDKMDIILGQSKVKGQEAKKEAREVEQKLAKVQIEEKKIERAEGTLLATERRIEQEEERIERKEDILAKEEAEQKAELLRVEDLEKKEVQLTEHELAKLRELEHLEQEIKKDVGPHPLMKITYKDFTRGLIGAFIALISHFAFVEGSQIAEGLTIQRATSLYVIAFLIGFLFIYYSGFRKVKDLAYLKIFPVRIFVIYFTAIIVVFLVLLLYGFIGPHSTFPDIYKQVASISIIAVIGAGTADLLGRE